MPQQGLYYLDVGRRGFARLGDGDATRLDQPQRSRPTTEVLAGPFGSGKLMQVGDLIRGVEGVNSLTNGIIVAIKQPKGEQKTERIVVLLQAGGVCVETRNSYNLWEVISHASR